MKHNFWNKISQQKNTVQKKIGIKWKAKEHDTTLQQLGQRCVRSAQRAALGNIDVDTLVYTLARRGRQINVIT